MSFNSSQQGISLKVTCLQSIRRITIPINYPFSRLVSRLTVLFEIPVNKLILLWFDGEDWITFSSDLEWLEACKTFLTNKIGSKFLRLKIEDPTSCILKSKLPKTKSNPKKSSNYPNLSSPIGNVKDHYDVVVIGSGYGGSICASRISRAGKSVCLLERGKELRPGEYPNTIEEGINDFQVTLPDGSIYGVKNGFYDFLVSPNCYVWRGNGLGGGSLVNSNVSIKPEPRVYDSWPTDFKKTLNLLDQGFQLSEAVLCPKQYPYQDTNPIPQVIALQKAAQNVGGTVSLAHVNVTFDDRTNDQGVFQPGCKLCGDCNSGCNYGSKNTLLMNYIPDAKQHGTDIYCNVQVKYLERQPDGTWKIYCELISQEFTDIEFTITSDLVVLGAGSLGSTEILLRSKSKGLKCSDKLGYSFGIDGDFFGFAYNSPDKINVVGYGNQNWKEMQAKFGPTGPCITAVWDLRDPKASLKQNVIIEDMSFPGLIGSTLSPLLVLGDSTEFAENTDPSGRLFQLIRMEQSLTKGPYYGATENTLFMGGMGHDDQQGVMSINSETDGLTISWSSPLDPVQNQYRNQIFKSAATNLKSVFIKNPAENPLIPEVPSLRGGVHPLGGCIMADTASTGVTNHKGQVFSSNSGTDVYSNLYVADSSIIPTSVGVNPLWIISALAERICILMAQDKGWKIDMSKKEQKKSYDW